MSTAHDTVMSDLAAHESEIDRAESRELAQEALIKEEVERLTTTREGVDEIFECILNRLGEDYTKAQFLDQVIGLMSVKSTLKLTVREVCLQSTLKVVAEVMAEDRAGDKLRELENEAEATRAGW